MPKKIDIMYLNDKCKLTLGSEGAFAFDVFANIEKEIVLKPGDVCSVPLGFAVDTGERTIGMFLLMRSGLAGNHGLMLMNSVGLLDSDFRGECIARIWNTGSMGKEYTIRPLERIGQVAFMEGVDVELNVVDKLNETKRGMGGFGSTGRVKGDLI